MRKKKKGRKLSRKSGPRKQLLKSLANSFFKYEKIITTEAKAKELRSFVEKLITRAKEDTVANRRFLARFLTPENVKKVFTQIAPLHKDRQGGYTRIVKLKNRNSDSAKLAIIELLK